VAADRPLQRGEVAIQDINHIKSRVGLGDRREVAHVDQQHRQGLNLVEALLPLLPPLAFALLRRVIIRRSRTGPPPPRNRASQASCTEASQPRLAAIAASALVRGVRNSPPSTTSTRQVEHSPCLRRSPRGGCCRAGRHPAAWLPALPTNTTVLRNQR
jgi:hypothetical protein